MKKYRLTLKAINSYNFTVLVLAASILFRLDDGIMSFNDSGLNIECNYFAQDFGLISSHFGIISVMTRLIRQWVK